MATEGEWEDLPSSQESEPSSQPSEGGWEDLPARKGAEGWEDLPAREQGNISDLNLTPQEKGLYQRHLSNLNGSGGVDNPDGSRSTLYQMSFERDGRTYNVPTVWDGKILKPDDAIKRAEQEGLEKFPSYGSQEEAEQRYNQMHSYMERDTQAFLAGRQKGWEDLPPTEQKPAKEQSALESGIRGAAHAVLPTAAAIGAGSLVAGPVGGLVAALLAGGVAGYGQEKLLEQFWPEEHKRMQEAEEQHPFATGAGGALAFGPFASIGLGNAAGSTLLRKAAPNITNAVAGGGIDLAISGDPYHAAGTGLASGAFGNLTPLGERVAGAGARAGARIGTRSEESLSASTARGMGERENAANGSPNVDPVADEAAVRNASQGAEGDFASKDPTVQTANERVSPGDGPDSGSKRDNPGPQEYGKGKQGGEGDLEARPAGEINEAVAAALKPKEPVVGSPEGTGEVPPGPKVEQTNFRPEEPAAREARLASEAVEAEKIVARDDVNQQQQQQKPSTLLKGYANMTADEQRAALGRAAAQQGEGAGGGKPPGAPPPGGGGKAAPPEPPPRYAGDKSTGEKAGETFNRTLDNLGRMQNADFYDFMGKLKTATQSAATLLGKGGQDISRAIESGKYHELPEQLRKHWEDFSGGIKKQITDLEAELGKRGIKPPETDDPNYVHRIRKMPFSWKDWINNDPVSALKGMIRPDMFKPLDFRGAEAADGTRLVLQDRSPTAYSIWRNGERSDYAAPQREEGAKGFKNGDKIEYNGKQYTVDRGRAEEITKHARDDSGKPIQYKENAAASLYEHRAQLKAAIAYDDMLRTFKGDKALDPYRMKASSQEGKNAIKNNGFVELHGEPFKDFEGIAMHPDLAQAIRNNYEPGLGIRSNPIVNAMRSLNQFAVKSIFWNPVPHSMNALMHYVVARGEDWLPFKFDKDSYLPKEFSLDNYRRLGESWKQAANVFRAYYDVGTQSGIMKDLNQSGVPLVQSSRERANAHEAIGNMLGANLRDEPRTWARWAQKFGLGQATDAVKAVYDASGKALWAASDAMMAARVYELEAKKLTREQAISHASVHMPDYVIPNKLFGARGLPNTMADPGAFMFGRYHVKVLDSLAHMSMDALGPNSTVEQRRQAFGNIMAVGILATVVYPALDAAVKAVTGNEDAQVRRRGPMAPLTNVKEAVAPEEGKPPRTYASAISNLATISPMARAMKEALLDNRDWRGKSIIEPASPFYKQAAQLGEYLTKTAVSPYATAEAATNEKGPGVASSLLQQVTDTKVPTDEQVGGQAKAAKSLQKQAIGRDKKPQGFIEQLLSGATQ